MVATLRLLAWGRMHEKKAHIWMFFTHVGDGTGEHGTDDGQGEEGEEGLKAALMAENGRGMHEDHIQRSAIQVQNRIKWSSTDSPE